MKPTRVLIIDDEKQNVRYLTTILEENGFTDIHAAFDGVEGLEKVESVRPGLYPARPPHAQEKRHHGV